MQEGVGSFGGVVSDNDIRSAFGFLYEAGEVDGPDAFTEPVLEAFGRLIPTDAGGACNVFGAERPGVVAERRTVLDFGWVDADWCIGLRAYWSDDLEEVCRLHVEKEEAVPPVPMYLNRPVRLSDVLTRRQQRARELWASVERVMGVEDAVVLWQPAPGEGVLRRFSFASGRRGGISDRDVRLLELLAPHLAQLHRRAAARRATAGWPADLTPREREVLLLVARGQTNREVARTLWISPHTVRSHLEHVFEKLGVTSRAAAVARALGAGNAGQGSWRPREDVDYEPLHPGASLIDKHAY
jgi:DNA-binding CsgD family transcriptional regulator